MIDEDFRLEDENRRQSINEMIKDWVSEKPGSGRMKIHSELTWEPSIDVVETDNEVIAVVDIAGMNGKDISVVTDGKVLRISGVRAGIGPAGKKQFHKLEIQVGRFRREIQLPVPVDHSKISANYNNGMLEIRIHKVKPPNDVRKVQID